MHDLNRALDDISSIRRQVAQSTEFRGYGPATLAATGALALAAAGAQALWVPDWATHLHAGLLSKYLGGWFATAVLSAALIAMQTLNRARRMPSGMADEMIRMAVE